MVRHRSPSGSFGRRDSNTIAVCSSSMANRTTCAEYLTHKPRTTSSIAHNLRTRGGRQLRSLPALLGRSSRHRRNGTDCPSLAGFAQLKLTRPRQEFLAQLNILLDQLLFQLVRTMPKRLNPPFRKTINRRPRSGPIIDEFYSKGWQWKWKWHRKRRKWKWEWKWK